jgi:TonB family protein
MRFLRLALALGWVGCQGKSPTTVTLGAEPPASSLKQDEPPVPLNADSPMIYPEALAAQRLGGTVLLKLFIDSAGFVVKESTTVQESSGYPALDSAAILGAPRLRYAPALRDGTARAAHFLQPVNFRAGGGANTP